MTQQNQMMRKRKKLLVNKILSIITSFLGYNYYKLYNFNTGNPNPRLVAKSNTFTVPLPFSTDIPDNDKQNLIETFQTTQKTRKAIIIVAFHRSGSSFTGELLNIHPDVFYSYEPLKLVNNGCGNIKKEERLKLMQDMINCEIPDISSDPEKYLQNPEFKNDENFYNETINSNFMFRTKSKRLCSGEFCDNQDFSNDSKKCRYSCPKIDIERARHVCSQKSVGIKVIRLCEMKLIEELILSMPHVDFRIVLLNRDPRGIISSRKKIFKEKLTQNQLVNNVKWTCNYMLSRYSSIFRNSWLQDFIFIARYEKISQNPIFASRNFYQFVGLQQYEEIEYQIKNMSQANSDDSYSTSKNSKRIWQNWRIDLDFELVQNVQIVCGDAMKTLGYKHLENEQDLKNFDIDLVQDISLEGVCKNC